MVILETKHPFDRIALSYSLPPVRVLSLAIEATTSFPPILVAVAPARRRMVSSIFPQEPRF